MSLLQTTLHILHNLIDSFDTPHSTTLRLFDSRSSVVESAPLFLALLVHGFSCGPIKGAVTVGPDKEEPLLDDSKQTITVNLTNFTVSRANNLSLLRSRKLSLNYVAGPREIRRVYAMRLLYKILIHPQLQKFKKISN
jgi:hypothetical protein